jgi:hypothetical protein
MTNLSSHQYVPNPRALFTELGDGTAVLLHLDTKFYYTLNATGVALWKALQEGVLAPEAIASRIAQEFAVDTDVASRDIEAVLQTLVAENLVVPAG